MVSTKIILVYDPTKAIASLYAPKLAKEGVELVCTDNLDGFLAASKQKGYAGIVAKIDGIVSRPEKYYDPTCFNHCSREGYDPKKEREKKESLENILDAAVLVQAENNSPILLEFYYNFRHDGYFNVIQETRSSVERRNESEQLPYTKEQIRNRFSPTAEIHWRDRKQEGYDEFRTAVYEKILKQKVPGDRPNAPVIPIESAQVLQLIKDFEEKVKPHLADPESSSVRKS
jgi:hypothetical protein